MLRAKYQVATGLSRAHNAILPKNMERRRGVNCQTGNTPTRWQFSLLKRVSIQIK